MIRKVSKGFWRSDDGRFDIYEVIESHESHLSIEDGKVVNNWTEVCYYVLYDFGLGKRHVFPLLAEALAAAGEPKTAA